MANKESTNYEILDAINNLSTQIDERFDKVEGRLDRIEATMVTKDYLDEKLADQRGDLVVLMRKEDNKFLALVEILKNKNVITAEDAKQIYSLEPFPKRLG